MKRFRTGRGAPPWAGGQTGPMTVDVEALMATRDQTYRYLPAALDSPTTQPTLPTLAAASTPSAASDIANEPDEPDDPGSFRTVKLVYVGPGSEHPSANVKVSPSRTEPTAEAKPVEDNPDLLADLPKEKPAKPKRKRKRKRKPLVAHATVRPTSPRKPRPPRTQEAIDLSRHRRRCGVCHDPQREAIEEAFLRWGNVAWIENEFEPEGGCSAIYRHAHAFNLFKKRSLNLRSALEYIIEESQSITPTAEGIVKAIRAYTRINDIGEWIDPPTKHIVQVVAVPPTDAGNLANPIQGLSLDVRKERSQIIFPDAGRVESAVNQPLLTETAQHSENAVTD